MLTRVFSDQEKVEIDRYQIRRETRTEYRQRDGQPFEKHYYWFGKRGTSNVENVEPGKFIKTPKPENFEKL